MTTRNCLYISSRSSFIKTEIWIEYKSVETSGEILLLISEDYQTMLKFFELNLLGTYV